MNTIEQAIQFTEQNLKQFIHNFSFIPDDKLNWSPSPSAKTPMQILAHCAVAAQGLLEPLTGQNNNTPIDQIIKQITEAEAELTNKDQALTVLKDGVTKGLIAMKALRPEDLDKVVNHPFTNAPISFWMNLFWRHLDVHGGQIDYLQTIWGDNDFHFAR